MVVAIVVVDHCALFFIGEIITIILSITSVNNVNRFKEFLIIIYLFLFDIQTPLSQLNSCVPQAEIIRSMEALESPHEPPANVQVRFPVGSSV